MSIARNIQAAGGQVGIPQWISAVGGSLSLLLALYIILRDRRKSERDQATRITAWQHLETVFRADLNSSSPSAPQSVVTAVTIQAHNASEMPVTNLGMISRAMTPKELRASFTKGAMKSYGIVVEPYKLLYNRALKGDDGEALRVLLPDMKAHLEERRPLDFTDPPKERDPYIQPLNAYKRWLLFVDSAGVSWFRDLNNGELLRASSPRTHRLLRGKFWPNPGIEEFLRAAMAKTEPFSFFMQLAFLIWHFCDAVRRLIRRMSPDSGPSPNTGNSSHP